MSENDHPLAGLKVLVTRALGQSHEFRELLAPLGAIVTEIPVIEIRKPDCLDDLDRALQNLALYQWIIFASKNAVDHTLARAQEIGIDLNTLSSNCKVAAIGPSTAGELVKKGIRVDFCPSSFMAEFLVDEFPGYPQLNGVRVLWPKTNIGRTLIADKLSAAGAQVDTALSYVTDLPGNKDEIAEQLVQALIAGEIDVITLASAQSAHNLAQLIAHGLANRAEAQRRQAEGPLVQVSASGDSCTTDQEKVKRAVKMLLSPVKIAAIGPITARTAREVLGKADVEAGQYTLAGLTEALLASLKLGQKEP